MAWIVALIEMFISKTLIIDVNKIVSFAKIKLNQLGLIIDSYLNWKAHIHELSEKISRGIGVLSKIRYYVNNSILQQLYYSLIYPFLTYGLSVWSNTYRPYLRPLERVSFECRKTKTKVITLTNHNSRKQSNEPIRARSKYMSPVPSVGKRMRVNHDWFWFYV